MAPDTNGGITISGTVYRKEGTNNVGLIGATVIAMNGDGTARTTQTEANGQYKLEGLKPGRWQISAWSEDYRVLNPQASEFHQDTAGQDIELSPGTPELKVAGTVCWRQTEERVAGALVKVVPKGKDGDGKRFKQAWTDDDGDFKCDGLRPGTWSFVVLHEDGHPTTTEKTLLQDQAGLRLEASKQMGTHDEEAGRGFLRWLCIALGLLAVVYVALHVLVPARGEPAIDTLVALTDQARAQASSTPEPGKAPVPTLANELRVTNELTVTVAGMRETWDSISRNTQALSEQDKKVLAELVAGVETAIEERDRQKLLGRLESLRGMAVRAPAKGLFWTTEPWRYLEVLLWGLAGILVSLIMSSGSYLRWRRFYGEGIPMHVSHVVTIPLLALVLVLLLSQITLTLSLAGSSSVQLALSDPRLLAAVSFLIGVRPWATWKFIVESAGKITGREA